jgi:hypothetical protein
VYYRFLTYSPSIDISTRVGCLDKVFSILLCPYASSSWKGDHEVASKPVRNPERTG